MLSWQRGGVRRWQRWCLGRMWLLVALLLAAAPLPSGAQDTYADVERVVAIGDVHGDYDRLVELLRSADLLDRRLAWAGGRTHLVLVGDFVDRGPASGKVIDLLMSLQPQAERAGGRVHALIGNHEAMNVYGDLRYVSRQDFRAYRDMGARLTFPPPAGRIGEPFDVSGSDIDPQPGRREQRALFGPDGRYGAWLRRQNVAVRINDLLFLHGGISPRLAEMPVAEINRRVRAELNDFSLLEGGLTMAPDGPLWYRGMAQVSEDGAAFADHVARVLRYHGVKHVVIAHTPTVAIFPRFDGQVILVDVGLSKFFGGPPAFLVAEGGSLVAVHRGRRIELPLTAAGRLPYLRQVAELEPSSSALRKLLERGGR